MSHFELHRKIAKEDCLLVYFGCVENNIGRKRQLRHDIFDIREFIDLEECISFILTFNNEQQIIVIIDTDQAVDYESMLSIIEPLRTIRMIYILCKSENTENIKRSTVKHRKTHLLPSETDMLMKHIFETVSNRINNDNISFQATKSIQVQNEAGIIEKSNKQEALFMYAQMAKEILFKFPATTLSKTEMIEFCRDLYNDSESELEFINEMEHNPQNRSIVYFYTSEHFLYRMLNRALRLQEMNKLYHLRYCICQLHFEIQDLYRTMAQGTNLIKRLYRGQGMFVEELEKLKSSLGGLLSFNTFLSTSEEYNVAYMYAESILAAPELLSVFMEINVEQSDVGKNVFASINHLTQFADEKEYLFSMGAIFRIQSMTRDPNGIYHVKLALTNEHDEDLARLKWFMSTTLNQSYNRGPLYELAGLMIEMNKYSHAEYFYNLLLKDESIKNESAALACIYGNMGVLNMEIGNSQEALKNYELALKIYEENPTDIYKQTIANLLGNIGEIHMVQKNFSQAISFYERALVMDLKPCNERKPNPIYISNRYNQLGVIYEHAGDYQKALDYYEKCLRMRLESMPSNHPDLIAPYNNIALLYEKLGRTQQAIAINIQLLEICENSLPPGHYRLATICNNLAFSFEDLGQFKDALLYAKRAYEIMEQSLLPLSHEMRISNRQHLEHLQNIVFNST